MLRSVTDVVLTHMHMDHIGGLLTDGGERPPASGPADSRGVPPRSNSGRAPDFLPRLHAAGGFPGRASLGRQAVRGRVTAASCGHSRTRVEVAPGVGRHSHRRPHPPGNSVVRVASRG